MVTCPVDEVEVNSLVFGIGFHVFKKAGSTAFVLHVGNAAFGSPYTVNPDSYLCHFDKV